MADEIQSTAGAAPDEDDDLIESTRTLLRELNIISADGDAAGAAAATPTGPPRSVADVEAGVTSSAKLWAAGTGALVVLVWAFVFIWWPGEETANQVAAIGAASIITGALIVAVAYLLSTDVRGRASAAVATIEAREHVALAMIDAAVATRTPELPPGPAEPAAELVALPKKVMVKYLIREGADRKGWKAIAIERRGENELRYLIVRGSEKALVEPEHVSFV